MKRVVFIIGAGRSGSSILHELLGYHPRIGWMSELCDRYPRQPRRNRQVLAAMRLPFVGPLLRRRFEPRECYAFFDEFYPGFSEPMRDLTAADLTHRAAAGMRTALQAVTEAPRDTLMVKLTGWPRIGFLAELFPEARFVHLVRDGRAVANSLLQVPWWRGWRGPDNWRFGPLPEPFRELWESHDRSFVALAAIEWRLIMDAVDSSRDLIPEGRMLDVRYEDLCESPVAVMKDIVGHFPLEWSNELNQALVRFPLRSRNEKWPSDLGAAAAVATSVLGEALSRYGYEA
ncbi:MAG: sulfotransferase [Gemmatimonadota bacterium]